MPVYEYQCSACKHEFEREQRISEDPIKKCPKCGKQKVKRLISRTSFVLKGGGWYGDLYGSVKPGAEKKDDAGKDSGASAAASDSSKGESAAPSGDAAAKTEKTGDAKPPKKGKSKKAAA
jgi:putative FmdB family regulatory protein